MQLRKPRKQIDCFGYSREYWGQGLIELYGIEPIRKRLDGITYHITDVLATNPCYPLAGWFERALREYPYES
jgi:hypothetical protein